MNDHGSLASDFNVCGDIVREVCWNPLFARSPGLASPPTRRTALSVCLPRSRFTVKLPRTACPRCPSRATSAAPTTKRRSQCPPELLLGRSRNS
ncbi:hypothetical protein BC826DRAFT_484642 [Russula brevipes]|nr:hypothetical protein BC826DRAFT_484642 [Russula brevipes]